MDAIVVDLKDFGLRTPEQVVRVFYESYSHETVKTDLWNLFISMAIGKGEDVAGYDQAGLALLFDDLISLVESR